MISLNDIVRTEFAKFNEKKSMINEMFLSTLNRNASHSDNSESNRTLTEFRDRLIERYEDIVSNGLDIAMATAEKNVRHQLNLVNNKAHKRSRTDTISDDDVHEGKDNTSLDPSAKRRRVDAGTRKNGGDVQKAQEREEPGVDQTCDEAVSITSDLEILRSFDSAVKSEKKKQDNACDVGTAVEMINDQELDDRNHRKDADEAMVSREHLREILELADDLAANTDSEFEPDAECGADLEQGITINEITPFDDAAITVITPFDDAVLELRANNDENFNSNSTRTWQQHIKRVLKTESTSELDNVGFSLLVQSEASKYFDHPIEYIDVEEDKWSTSLQLTVKVGTCNVSDSAQLSAYKDRSRLSHMGFAPCITKLAEFTFRIHLPNQGEYTRGARRRPLTIIHSKDWTANELIQSILKLAVDAPLIGYAFFADVIKYITEHELEKGSDYDPNKVDISLLQKLDPARFLIYCDSGVLKPKPFAYHKTDQYSHGSDQASYYSMSGSAKFEIQLLPLHDPLVTGATEIKSGQELQTHLMERSLTKSVWIEVRNSENGPVGITRCIVRKGQTLAEVCQEHVLSGYDNSRLYSPHRCGLRHDGTLSMVPWERMWDTNIFETLTPIFGHWTIYVSRHGKYFCRHLCGKEYVRWNSSWQVTHEMLCLHEHIEK